MHNLQVSEEHTSYFSKLNNTDPKDKVDSEYWTDDEIESYYANISEGEIEPRELVF